MKYIRGGLLLATAFFGVQTSWAQTPTFTIQNFAISGNTLLSADVTQAAVAPFIGKERGMDDITKAADALRNAYAAPVIPSCRFFRLNKPLRMA